MPKVKVGVAWRRDGNNEGHAGDLAVFQHPSLVNEVEVYTLAWAGATTAPNLNKGELKNMDLLVIPGGPHANATQIPVVGQSVAKEAQGSSAVYAGARAKSELDLIEQARTLGMPILALCGGSWRLVQNYGGSTVELAAVDANGKLLIHGSNPQAQSRHAANMDNVKTEFKHPLSIKPGSLLEDATGRAQKPGSKPLPPMQANSVHWAAVRTQVMGSRPGLPAQPFEVVPNNMLRMSAKDPSTLATSEAVESQHGAPVIGVQWHPEYQLPVNGGKQAASRLANLNLLQWMIKAGRAYRAHRDAMAEMLKLAQFGGTATPRTASEVQFRGAPVHTGVMPGAPPASTIPIKPHKEDIADPAGMARAEQAVRSYLFNLGRKGKLFLTPVELFNLATGAPLSRIHEDEDLKAQPVINFMERNVWAQKYCDEEGKQTIVKKWPRT
jgi:gamma-glutamyl-gamma-aminobutyrate hydrolase PuuD